MRRALVALMILVTAPAHANDLYGYYDFIVPEVVGQIGARDYDLYAKVGDDTRFAATQPVAGGTYVGGGFGLHVLVVMHHGLLVGGEASVSGGRIDGAQLPWGSTSTAMHYRVATNLGYALSLGQVAMIHAAGVLGFDGMRFDVAGPLAPVAALTDGSGAPVTPTGFQLSRFDLRAGATVGVHVNLAKVVAVWADGEIDYDGQWQVRAGIAIGAPYNVRF
jgi:hypothetical protein